MGKSLSVSDLTNLVRETLTENKLLANVWVSGEVSNFKAHTSGHCYFTLKDERASTFMPSTGRKLSVLARLRHITMRMLARSSLRVK